MKFAKHLRLFYILLILMDMYVIILMNLRVNIYKVIHKFFWDRVMLEFSIAVKAYVDIF